MLTKAKRFELTDEYFKSIGFKWDEMEEWQKEKIRALATRDITHAMQQYPIDPDWLKPSIKIHH